MFKYFILFSLLIIPLSTYSQEEFFGNNDGFSYSFLQGFQSDIHHISGGGCDIYSKTGLAMGLGFEYAKEQVLPFVSLSYFIKSSHEKGFAKTALGITYSKTNQFNVVGGYMTAIICFLRDSNFPFSLSGSMAMQIGFLGYNNYKKYTTRGIEAIPVLSLSYKHAFFIQKSIYPFIGISYGFEGNSNTKLLIAFTGLNIRMNPVKKNNTSPPASL